MTASIYSKPLVLVYEEINVGKFKSTKHFKCVNEDYKKTLYSELLNFSADRNCAISMPDYWLQVREGKKWKKPRLTGLFKTESPNIYVGDIGTRGKKTNSVLFKFLKAENRLTIYHFHAYTNDVSHLIQLINK